MITKTIASRIMIGLLGLVLVFHLLIITQIISCEVVWAGKISSIKEMYMFEAISVIVNALMITVIFVKLKALKKNESNRFINGLIWAFVFIFSLNTLGNLFATHLAEQILATTLTLISAILCWIIVRKGKK